MMIQLRMLVPPRFPAARKLLGIAALFGAYTGVVAWIEHFYHPGPLSQYDWGLSVINGLILGSLVTFRTNEAKRRFWEARTLWGQLINESRNMLIKAHSLESVSSLDRAHWAKLIVGFGHALRMHLRGGRRLQDVPGFAEVGTESMHVPLYLATLVQDELARWRREGKLDDMEHWMFDRHARELMNICGGCERIRNTPIPLTYRALVHRGITLIMFVMPVLIAQDIGYWAIPIMAVTAYFVFGVEMAAVDIEEPFGNDPDDLPLESFCEVIEISAAQTLGQREREQVKM
jgi:putative membrane protein